MESIDPPVDSGEGRIYTYKYFSMYGSAVNKPSLATSFPLASKPEQKGNKKSRL
jgi:hypothetical protein